MSLVSTSGIRGPVGQTVTADLALDLGGVIATRSNERVVVGHDARETSEWLRDSLTAGLRACGADVVNIGLVSTPTLARSVEWVAADLGVMVTASHNPAKYNGFKLVHRSGQAFTPDEINTLIEAIEDTAYAPVAWDRAGTQERCPDVTDQHVEAIRESVGDLDGVSIVVDVGNGAGGVAIDALVALGASVESLYDEPNGRFPNRASEPTAETCAELQRRVTESAADLGIAFDGDADRMQAVTESGQFVLGDVLLALFAREAADRGQRVVAPINTSLAVDDALDRDVTVTRTAIGDTHVAGRARDSDVAFGGEPSGAWIWPDEVLAPDGPLAACRLAKIVAQQGSLDALVEAIDRYPLRRRNVEVEAKHTLMAPIEASLLDEYGNRCSTTDGVFVEATDGWFLIRPSGTEPLLRLTAEGDTRHRADELIEVASDYVENARNS